MISHVLNTPARDLPVSRPAAEITPKHLSVLRRFRELKHDTRTISVIVEREEWEVYRLFAEAREAERSAR